jgi:2-polyprenyl-3-methyl-5-hydroxy-6-metoxy-1,4-benzoquinol methylase
MLCKELHEQNRLSWNGMTSNWAVEAPDRFEAGPAMFLQKGGSTLYPEEVKLLGDIAGLSLVHLQCNAGMDSLSLAQLGAHVTGVDISDTAIDLARKFSEDSGIPATFYCMDIYDWLERAAKDTQRYDVAFSSYGFLFWLSDIETWAKGIAAILKPGGRFVMVELHPIVTTLDEHWRQNLPYFFDKHVLSWVDGTGPGGSDDDTLLSLDEVVVDSQSPCFYEFHWGIGEVVTTLLDAGLAIRLLREYPYWNGDSLWFQESRELPGGRIMPPEDVPNLPLMYSIVAAKI